MHNNNNNYRPVINLAIVLLLFYCSSLFSLIPIYLFNIDVKTCSDTLYNFLRIFPNIMLSIIFVFMYKKELLKDLKDFKKNFGKITDISIKYWFIGFICMLVSNFVIQKLLPVTIASNEQNVRSIISTSPFMAFFATCIFAPFLEEMIFRKSFRDPINNKWLYLCVSGFVFGALHVVNSITSLYGLFYIIPYSSLGIAFAYTYYKTDNIFASIFAHFLHNTSTFIILLLYVLR